MRRHKKLIVSFLAMAVFAGLTGHGAKAEVVVFTAESEKAYIEE